MYSIFRIYCYFCIYKLVYIMVVDLKVCYVCLNFYWLFVTPLLETIYYYIIITRIIRPVQEWNIKINVILRSFTKLPIVLKGIMSPADAIIAADLGCSGVFVSNHGGRQLDTAPATVRDNYTVFLRLVIEKYCFNNCIHSNNNNNNSIGTNIVIYLYRVDIDWDSAENCKSSRKSHRRIPRWWCETWNWRF